MREIKFRVFSSEVGRFEHFPLNNITVSDRLLSQHSYPVQQFTGIKDKNGKDIYEGDVVSFPPDLYKTENELCVVVWLTPSWMYRDVSRIVSPVDRLPFSFHGEKDHMAEVIGNIFENPKLLKYALDDDERAARLEAFSERLEARCDPANED